MIESIYKIGRAVMEGTTGIRAFLEALAESLPSTKKVKPKITILKIDTKLSTLDIEVREIGEHGNNTVERFLWLGNASSASDQDRLTTDGLHYLLSQTLPNLVSAVKVDTPFYTILTRVISDYFIDIGEQETLNISESSASYRRSRKLLNLPMLGIEGPELGDLQKFASEKESAKGLPKLVSDALAKHFKQSLGRERILFTFEVDGKLLLDYDEYLAHLENAYVGEVFDKAEVGCCHLTGKVEPITSNLTRLEFKYYITDKLGFASGFRKDRFKSNLAISKDAYIALLVGERFVKRELRFYIAGTNGYVLPNLYHVDMTADIIRDIISETRRIKKRTDINLGIQEKIDEIYDYKAGERNYSLNLLFYKRANASFKVVRLIQDVPEYRLYEIRQAGSKAKEEVGNLLFGENGDWDLTLKKIYWLLPVRVTKVNNNPVYHTRRILEFYTTLIIGGLIDTRQLVQNFMELVRVYRFDNFDAYHLTQLSSGTEDYKLISYVAQSIILLAFLRLQNQLKEENVLQEYLNDLDLYENQKQFLERLNYSKSQAALYFVGVLVAEIANAQYRLGSGGKGGKKTILNKLNYQGMTLKKVQRLLVDLFDKLRQYRDGRHQLLLNARNEKIFAQAQSLLSEGAGSWSLSPNENIYYILSGYSHTTLQAINNSRTTANAEDEKEREQK